MLRSPQFPSPREDALGGSRWHTFRLCVVAVCYYPGAPVAPAAKRGTEEKTMRAKHLVVAATLVLLPTAALAGASLLSEHAGPGRAGRDSRAVAGGGALGCCGGVVVTGRVAKPCRAGSARWCFSVADRDGGRIHVVARNRTIRSLTDRVFVDARRCRLVYAKA